MEAFSSSVSNLKLPTLHQPSSRNYNLHRVLQPPHHHKQSSITTTTWLHNSVSSTAAFSHQNALFPAVSSLHVNVPSWSIHKSHASGYAAALVDISQSNGKLEKVEKDVQRLMKILGNQQVKGILENSSVKGNVVREIVEKGNFERSLVGVVKILVEKNKVEMLWEVLYEFERLYDELWGTQVVFVSSRTKLGGEKLSGIAKKVQVLCGAVKVKVRNFVNGEVQSSYAV